MANAIAIGPCSRRALVKAQAANLLSASRFVFAAAWLIAFVHGDRRPAVLGSIALCAALSDLADGPLARQMRSAHGFGRWLDSLADIAFVLTALSCEAQAGVIPVYIPFLIGISFAQYAIDSIAISSSALPVRSRLGHWGGVTNFALVLLLAFAPYPQRPAIVIREASPLLAIFYFAAIIERTLRYVTIQYPVPSLSVVSSRLARGR
jgi:phosphatidylglycerophosphate synthase